MSILVVGASGATGRLLTQELLDRGHHVKAVVRTLEKLPQTMRNHPNLYLTEATLLDLSDSELAELTKGCHAVASCLGHNLTFKGLYGHPRQLVTEATRRLCQAIKANHTDKPIKFVLMNTAGNRNRDLNEPISPVEKVVVGLIRLLLPPHSDNENAADYLRKEIGQQNKQVEWTVVRPDSLINQRQMTPYQIHPSPISSAIFNPGKTSRINVAHFMADLMSDEPVWHRWQGQMPVIYNTDS